MIAGIALACGRRARNEPSASSSASVPPDAVVSPPPRKDVAKLPTNEGNAIARTLAGDALFVADEDDGSLYRVPLPLDAKVQRIALPGRPAQLLMLGDRMLVTIRDPGLVLIMRGKDEEARVAIA